MPSIRLREKTRGATGKILCQVTFWDSASRRGHAECKERFLCAHLPADASLYPGKPLLRRGPTAPGGAGAGDGGFEESSRNQGRHPRSTSWGQAVLDALHKNQAGLTFIYFLMTRIYLFNGRFFYDPHVAGGKPQAPEGEPARPGDTLVSRGQEHAVTFQSSV